MAPSRGRFMLHRAELQLRSGGHIFIQKCKICSLFQSTKRSLKNAVAWLPVAFLDPAVRAKTPFPRRGLRYHWAQRIQEDLINFAEHPKERLY